MTQRDCGNTPAGLQSAIDSVQAVLSSIELEIPAAFQIGEHGVLDAFYQSTGSRAELAARCEALAARARASAQAFLPASYAGFLSAAAPEECEEEVSGLRDARAAFEAAMTELRALDEPPATLARLEEAGSLLSRAVDAVSAQLSSARAATAELRGALEEALNDAREAEEKLCAERERANALEMHLRIVLSREEQQPPGRG